MTFRTFVGCSVCALLVLTAATWKLTPSLTAQQVYPIVRTTSASAVLTASTNTLSTAAEALVGSSLTAWECVVQNDPDNTVDMLVGSAAAQTIQLVPGQSITIPIQDANTIYVKAVTSTPVANYLCR